MHSTHLYTVITEVDQTQEVFIDQVHTSAKSLDKILFAWVEQAVARGFIKGTEDPQVPFRDMMERNNQFEKIGSVFNAWRIEFLIGKDFYVEDAILARHGGLYSYASRDLIYCTIDFIKTSMSESSMILSTEDAFGPTDSRYVRHAEEKYASHLERYERLKGVSALTRSITQERKRAEKQLLYWDAKRRFLRRGYNRDVKSEEECLYTINFNYEYYRTSGVWTYQDTEIGTDINYVFYAWVRRFLYDTWRPDADSDYREQIITDQDRMLLMEKVSLGHYSPAPVAGLTNVWGTYFSLSEGMVKLTIIKTALDEVVQG